MTLEEAEEIINAYQKYEDVSCCCHLGNPPCSKCENQPSEEEYNEALLYDFNKDED